MTQLDKIHLTTFNPRLSENLKARNRAKKLCVQLNNIPSDQHKARKAIFQELFGTAEQAFIEPHFFCDYGFNIFLGKGFFANHNCVFLDADKIVIGENVLLGPNVHLYTTTHPISAADRIAGLQLIAPIHLGNCVWIGGNSVVMPGVSIGDNSVVGAGSVVTRSLPANVVAAGAPCNIIRELNAEDQPLK